MDKSTATHISQLAIYDIPFRLLMSLLPSTLIRRLYICPMYVYWTIIIEYVAFAFFFIENGNPRNLIYFWLRYLFSTC